VIEIKSQKNKDEDKDFCLIILSGSPEMVEPLCLGHEERGRRNLLLFIRKKAIQDMQQQNLENREEEEELT
jgi:hypothetical protein